MRDNKNLNTKYQGIQALGEIEMSEETKKQEEKILCPKAGTATSSPTLTEPLRVHKPLEKMNTANVMLWMKKRLRRFKGEKSGKALKCHSEQGLSRARISVHQFFLGLISQMETFSLIINTKNSI
jgi:hypothetical protein